MKKIELVMNNLALDMFEQSAAELGIREFDVVQVRCSSARYVERQRLYRGQGFTVDLLARSKVEFEVSDEAAMKVVHALVGTIHPDSISIFKIDKVAGLDCEGLVTEKFNPATRHARP